MKNIFTGKDVPAYFTSLTYDASTFSDNLTFKSVELPYFALRSVQEQKEHPLHGEDSDFNDIISEIAWHKIDPVHVKQSAVLRELRFLEPLCLSIYKDGYFYISRLIYILYDAEDGIFAHFEMAEDRKDHLTPLMRLFQIYVLPGQYWMAYYARKYLTPNIGESTELNGMLLEIQKAWNAIEGEYGTSV